MHGWCTDHIGILKINGSEGFGMGLELCGFLVLFGLVWFWTRQLWLKYGKTWYPFNLCAYYIMYFSLYLRVESRSSFPFLAFGPSLQSLPPCWSLKHHSALLLDWMSGQSIWAFLWVVFFFLLVINNSANDNIVSFKERDVSLPGGTRWLWWRRMRWLCLLESGLATNSYLQFSGWIMKVF